MTAHDTAPRTVLLAGRVLKPVMGLVPRAVRPIRARAVASSPRSPACGS